MTNPRLTFVFLLLFLLTVAQDQVQDKLTYCPAERGEKSVRCVKREEKEKRELHKEMRGHVLVDSKLAANLSLFSNFFCLFLPLSFSFSLHLSVPLSFVRLP